MSQWGNAVLRIAEKNPDVSLVGNEAKPVSEKKRNKFNAQTVTVDGLQFASKNEAKRYHALCLLERTGAIYDLTVQPSFELQPAFVDKQGRRHRAITYTADFQYVRDGETIVEDVKGGKATQTQQFRMRWKMVIRQNPNIRFELAEG